mmetsp:Transcript_40699/g.59796  ORF Transcript_40699/g.59796 Transcript_40699/m.59796 type:complete len:427 (-) Transcript_40699:109-1389(-)|eukprot:CAMPEP_0195518790 /NCGR_PEP_ID=MMETSP0794_2-20130614/13682_1 /TAXON_ID=515487 /ORGANISM="Stephanopyxis turris, Strain CCMP 815" /LENGTH=426 /DNA_ID=CAMNT_0040647815 /DNA_START=17 /DNA_END=1297 /DNA_ORIENTATION=+
MIAPMHWFFPKMALATMIWNPALTFMNPVAPLFTLSNEKINIQPPTRRLSTFANISRKKTTTFKYSSKNNDDLSAAAKERRDEERRRKDRINDVVVGRTSAIPDAKNYEINPSATEKDFFALASDVEREVNLQTDKGLRCLKLLQLEQAREAFDRVYELKPRAYLWQMGVVLFYLNDVYAAAECFAKNAEIYENKFFESASEERIWRDACELKLLSKLSKRDIRKRSEAEGLYSKSLSPEIPPLAEAEVGKEMRKVVRIARDLFDASVSGDNYRVILSRAKLRAICSGPSGKMNRMDPKKWKLNSWYYLGLHYDALGEVEESKKCMKNALKFSGGGNSDDITDCLPLIHMARRDWFDDDEMEDYEDSEEQVSVMVDSIKDSLDKMTIDALKEALKKKGLHSTGSKPILQQRLFKDFLENVVSVDEI